MTFGVDLFSVLANKQSSISGFRRDVDEICALLGYYAASSDNHLPTFQDNVSVPSSGVKKSYFMTLEDVSDTNRALIAAVWKSTL
jgi:uracil phosphoribosyltransferase